MREDDHNNFIELKNASQIKFLTSASATKRWMSFVEVNLNYLAGIQIQIKKLVVL